jgi:endoglucanase
MGFLLFMSLACVSFVPTKDTKAATIHGFVNASGTVLVLDGQTFIPKGTNIIDFDSFWDPSSTTPGLDWVREKDFGNLKAAGFNSVRLVVKSDYFQNPDPPHAFSEQGFAWLDKVIALSRKHGLKIILDMHIPSGGQYQDYQINPGNQIFWNDDWHKGRFVDVWREIARRYADEDTIWAYDLMNEPATVDFTSYERLMRNTVNSIRLYDTNHLVMTQRGMNIKDDQSWDLKYPQVVDEQLIRSIHFYQPTDFTLQGAAWITDQKPMVAYPAPPSTTTTTQDEIWSADRVRQELTEAVQEAQASGTPAVLTEFGAIFPPQLSGQYEWIRDVATTVQAMGVGWHYWNYASPSCYRQTALWDQTKLCHPLTWAMLSSLARPTE